MRDVRIIRHDRALWTVTIEQVGTQEEMEGRVALQRWPRDRSPPVRLAASGLKSRIDVDFVGRRVLDFVAQADRSGEDCRRLLLDLRRELRGRR